MDQEDAEETANKQQNVSCEHEHVDGADSISEGTRVCTIP